MKPIRIGHPAMWALAAAVWLGVLVVWFSGREAGDDHAAGSAATQSSTASVPMAIRTASESIPGAERPVVSVVLHDIKITIEIADDPAAMQRGLMFRETMPENHGMLFIWPDEQPRAMWMRDTPLPLSVAFIDGQGKILNIADMTPFSEDIHASRGAARFALEMHQGWFERHGIASGDRIDFLSPASPLSEPH